MKKKLLLGLSFLLLNQTFALSIDENHPIKAFVPLTQTKSFALLQNQKKEIMLMNIQLSTEEKELFMRYRFNNIKKMNAMNLNLPSKSDVGMNNVPVLDQGAHGSCATFANTAAVDALLRKGDYISQLCHLELGQYLQERSSYPSGWEGSWGPIVLDQISRFGIVSKKTQYSRSCAGMTEYPLNNSRNIGKPLSLDEFKTLKEDVTTQGIWSKPLLDAHDRISKYNLKSYDGNKLLNEVKENLSSKESSRLTFGVMLVNGNCGGVGSCAKYQVDSDTWALTDYINEHPGDFLGGHEMIIIGYDDNAVAVDKQGNRHTGLLTLRNSWGEEAGFKGNYYMTYDYFKQYVVELNKISLGFNIV